MLSLITPKLKGQVGLYRDGGLAVCKATPSSGESLSSADLIATLLTNVIYVFLKNS